MPKKTKKISKQAQGWITRRAREKAKYVNETIANSSDVTKAVTIGHRSGIAAMRKALKDVTSPMVLLDSPMMPIGKKSSGDFAAEIVLAARKKGGTEAVERLLEHRISTVVSDTRDEAWQMHHRLTMNSDVRRRNRTIADFMVMATQHPAQVTLLGGTTVQAIIEALEEAGYTEHGRSSPSENAATDTKAVR